MGDRAVSFYGRSRGWTVSILLLSLGGGGGNILRSLKALFRRDLLVTQKSDPKYAERLKRAICTRFIDTNEFSLSDVPRDERLLIGARTTGRLGARHNPEVARQALEESKSEVNALLSGYSVVIVIGTGGKGTGAGTMFPVVQMARQHKCLVIPIFVRPSFERHEVDKRRFDHALSVIDQFDKAQIRFIEILNDLGYADRHPEPQSVVWERMTLPIARGLRGLIYVLSDLSQVDPSDLSTLVAGPGRIRIGFAEIDPPASQDPDGQQIEDAVRTCWQNSYYAFGKPVGTSLVCIQGEWSNVVDAGIKGRLAALASGDADGHPYTPLYARAPRTPKPWGVTALFAEYTGNHAPLAIDWNLEGRISPLVGSEISTHEVAARVVEDVPPKVPVVVQDVGPTVHDNDEPKPSFASLWEFAVAVNRSDPAALAVARDGTRSEISFDGREVKKLLGTMWFRGVVSRLSPEWRDRLLEALVASAPVPDHVLKIGRHSVRLSQLSLVQLRDVFTNTSVADGTRADLEFLIIVANLWGEQALGRFQFAAGPEDNERSRFANALGAFRV
jgi:cell division GTPase FtsZ